MNRPLITSLDAIHTCHTPAVIDLVFLHVDARSLALLSAKSAVAALLCVDHRRKDAETREEAQNRTYRTYGVAPCPSVLPCKNTDHHKGHDGYREC